MWLHTFRFVSRGLLKFPRADELAANHAALPPLIALHFLLSSFILSLSHLFSISVSIYTFLSSSLTLSCSSYLFPPLSPRFSPPSSRVSLFFNLFSRYILFCSFLRFFQSLDLYTSHPRFFFPSSGFTLFPAHDSSYRARKTRFRSQKHFEGNGFAEINGELQF